MRTLATAVAVVGGLCWAIRGIVGYRRVQRLAVQAELSGLKQVIRTWAISSGAGLSLLLVVFFVLLILQSAADLGWSQQHWQTLAIMLAAAALSGVWTACLFYWEALRGIRRRRQSGVVPADTRGE